MKKIRVLKNPIQNYAWGSHTALAELLGSPTPSTDPEAELWMGAHPKAPSSVWIAGRWQALPDWIATAPEDILGREVCRRFNRRLPYLFKVLAIEKPLSIQAHPNQKQARQGFARENQRGIPLDAPQRNYRDANHKPECICALTPFTALCGFRPIADIIAMMTPIASPEMAPVLHGLNAETPARSLRGFFQGLMSLDSRARDHVIQTAITHIRQMAHPDEVYTWVRSLHASYPGDIGALAPLFLNLVILDPGDALFLPAGELHAYLRGVGVELMANSDNVLRGGLTPKHVDLPELMQVLTFDCRRIAILTPQAHGRNERRYLTSAAEFVLSRIRVSTAEAYHSADHRSVEILLCVRGEAQIKASDDPKRLNVRAGTSLIVPAAVSAYVIQGQAELYKAAVPV